MTACGAWYTSQTPAHFEDSPTEDEFTARSLLCSSLFSAHFLTPEALNHIPCSLRTRGLPLGGLADVSHSKPKLSDHYQKVHRLLILMMVVGNRDSAPCVLVEEAKTQRC